MLLDSQEGHLRRMLSALGLREDHIASAWSPHDASVPLISAWYGNTPSKYQGVSELTPPAVNPGDPVGYWKAPDNVIQPHMVQAAGGNKPTVSSDRLGIHFNGFQWLGAGALPADSPAQISVVGIASLDAGAGTPWATLACGSDVSFTAGWWLYYLQGFMRFTCNRGNNSNAVVAVPVLPAPASVYIGTYDGNGLLIYKDNVAGTTPSDMSGAYPTNGSVSIGALDNFGDRPYEGNIYYFGIHKGILSSSDRAKYQSWAQSQGWV